MLRITTLAGLAEIENPALRTYIRNKAETMIQEYGVDTLDDIGCFVVLDKTENQQFPVQEMEFSEIVMIEEEAFLHGVRILGDSYGEDIFLPVEVVEC